MGEKYKAAVFDMHGIIYTHDRNNSIEKSTEMYKEKIWQYITDHKNQYKHIITEELAEYELIRKGCCGLSESLGIYFFPEAIELLRKFQKAGVKIIIVSAAKYETIQLILSIVDKKIKVGSMDIYSTCETGSKSDYNTWYKIFSKYKGISYIFEDDKNNLAAAEEASKLLGFTSFCSTSINSVCTNF